jgi:hypothetical protein
MRDAISVQPLRRDDCVRRQWATHLMRDAISMQSACNQHAIRGRSQASVGSGPHTKFFRSPRQSTGFGRPPLLLSSRTRHRIGFSANSNSGEPSCPTAPDEGGNQQSSANSNSGEPSCPTAPDEGGNQQSSANSNSGEPSCPTAPDEGGNQQSSANSNSGEPSCPTAPSRDCTHN